MRVAFYVRVSTERQQQAQTIEQQVTRLREFIASQDGWTVEEEHIFRDDGFSGAKLSRPGLDALRDQAAQARFERVLLTAPDRLARNYVHQMVLIEELERVGCPVQFIDRPLSDDPHEQLVVQIRGAVAEYERTLIADRMRRGRLAKLQSGRLLPWTRPPYGLRVDPDRPRDPALVRIDPCAGSQRGPDGAWSRAGAQGAVDSAVSQPPGGSRCSRPSCTASATSPTPPSARSVAAWGARSAPPRRARSSWARRPTWCGASRS
jgi:site-specific DNA recombinase